MLENKHNLTACPHQFFLGQTFEKKKKTISPQKTLKKKKKETV